MAAEAINGGVAAGAEDLKATFRQIYGTLKSELLHDEAFDYTDEARQWIERMLDYYAPGGNLNQGMSVIDSYKLLKEGKQLTNEESFLGCALGWCIEWLQAYSRHCLIDAEKQRIC